MHEVFDHTADIGLRIRAATLEQLFCEAATALFELIVANLTDVLPQQKLQFTLPQCNQQYDYLLFDWLNELLYTFEVKHLVLAKFEVTFTPEALQATAWGEPLDPPRHHAEHEVKAITYHGLKVIRAGSDWLAEVIVDI